MQKLFYILQGLLRRLNFKTRIILYYYNFQKLYNLAKSTIELYQKKETILTYPKMASIEIINVCNLNCPCCPTSINKSNRNKRLMTFEEFKNIVDQLSDNIFIVHVGVNGEPFLNKDIFKMISYLKSKNIGSMVESNFNLPDRDYVKKILDSGLGFLSLSIDGASQETYSLYRRGGNFDNVIENLKQLVSKKKEKKLRFPFIQWQYIVMKHNEHEVEKAKKIACKIGVDAIRWDLPFIPLADSWFFNENQNLIQETMKQYQPRNKKFIIRDCDRVHLLNCNQAFQELQVLVDGSVIPCCRLREKSVSFGNVFNQSFDQIWNNDIFRMFRRQLKEQGNKSKCNVCLANIRKFNNN